MTMLSDKELAEALREVTRSVNTDRGMSRLDLIEAHIDALTAQRDRARSIAVSLEQELAEIQRDPMLYATGVSWTDDDSDADQVIAEFDAAAKVALRGADRVLGTWSAPDGSHGVSASGPWKASGVKS